MTLIFLILCFSLCVFIVFFPSHKRTIDIHPPSQTDSKIKLKPSGFFFSSLCIRYGNVPTEYLKKEH
uniref:Secreted protein n=1 Tax=Amphilophus citrinellus TaxID=61819 RepID=A0A3Q0RDY8_AMPCI